MNNRTYTKNAFGFSKELRKNQTDSEKLLWNALRNRGLNNIKFRRQVPVNKYIVDFLCMGKKLIIELDGSQHIDNIEYDNQRTTYLNKMDYQILRINSDEVLRNLDIVLEFILETYNKL